MTLDRFDDELASALRAEVPEPAPDYWQRIDATLGNVAVHDITPAETEAPAKPRIPVWPAVAAAALILAGILVIGTRWGRDSEQLVAGDRNNGDPALEAGDGNGPRANLDHWQGLYAVWDCTQNEGEGGWLPEFQSTRDDWGLHSHGDGLLSIHPFFEEAAEENATLSLFAETMGIEITDEAITLEDGRVLSEATTSCGGEPGTVQVRRWPSAPALEADADLAPRVVTTDVAGERFMNNLEVWTIAFAPLDADIPLPPRDRFDRLAGWWWTGGEPASVEEIEQRDTELPPDLPSATDEAASYSIPEGDVSVWVSRGDDQAEAERQVKEALRSLPESAAMGPDDLVAGTSTHFVAAVPETRQVLDLFRYRIADRGRPDRQHDCHATRAAEAETLWTAGCRFDDGRGNPPPVRQQLGLIDDAMSLTTWNLPEGSRSMRVTTSTGWMIVANVIDSTSVAAWSQERGDIATIEIFDANLNILWTG